MAIFNSYVKLPEGIVKYFTHKLVMNPEQIEKTT